ncbi:MAG: OmpA family protein [Spirochaetaceae bacterium]|jgi:outer membrane protein OmpA-like peptidoglycan-associated protein|nr:OmpA family protein [Spirochaetaceae bacterium]
MNKIFVGNSVGRLFLVVCAVFALTGQVVFAQNTGFFIGGGGGYSTNAFAASKLEQEWNNRFPQGAGGFAFLGMSFWQMGVGIEAGYAPKQFWEATIGEQYLDDDASKAKYSHVPLLLKVSYQTPGAISLRPNLFGGVAFEIIDAVEPYSIYGDWYTDSFGPKQTVAAGTPGAKRDVVSTSSNAARTEISADFGAGIDIVLSFGGNMALFLGGSYHFVAPTSPGVAMYHFPEFRAGLQIYPFSGGSSGSSSRASNTNRNNGYNRQPAQRQPQYRAAPAYSSASNSNSNSYSNSRQYTTANASYGAPAPAKENELLAEMRAADAQRNGGKSVSDAGRPPASTARGESSSVSQSTQTTEVAAAQPKSNGKAAKTNSKTEAAANTPAKANGKTEAAATKADPAKANGKTQAEQPAKEEKAAPAKAPAMADAKTDDDDSAPASLASADTNGAKGKTEADNGKTPAAKSNDKAPANGKTPANGKNGAKANAAVEQDESPQATAELAAAPVNGNGKANDKAPANANGKTANGNDKTPAATAAPAATVAPAATAAPAAAPVAAETNNDSKNAASAASNGKPAEAANGKPAATAVANGKAANGKNATPTAEERAQQEALKKAMEDQRAEIAALKKALEDQKNELANTNAQNEGDKTTLRELQKSTGGVRSSNGELSYETLPGARLDTVYFFPDMTQSVITYSLPVVDEVGRRLKENPNLTVTIRGYAAPAGSTEGQMVVSESRARYSANYLNKNYGVSLDRITIEWYGATKRPEQTGQYKDIGLYRAVELVTLPRSADISEPLVTQKLKTNSTVSAKR